MARRVAKRVITVSGNATVRVAPDQVTITVGVETWNADLAVAKAENEKRVAKMIAAVGTHGHGASYIPRPSALARDPRGERKGHRTRRGARSENRFGPSRSPKATRAGSYGSYWGGHRGGGMSQNVLQMHSGGPSLDGGALEPGRISVTADISVTFRLSGG